MLGAIAGDIIGSVYEHSPIKTKDFPLFGPHSRFTDGTSAESWLNQQMHYDLWFAKQNRKKLKVKKLSAA